MGDDTLTTVDDSLRYINLWRKRVMGRNWTDEMNIDEAVAVADLLGIKHELRHTSNQDFMIDLYCRLIALDNGVMFIRRYEFVWSTIYGQVIEWFQRAQDALWNCNRYGAADHGPGQRWAAGRQAQKKSDSAQVLS